MANKDQNDHLYLLWTSDNYETAEKMVLMYAINAMTHGWWEKITLIIWGAPATLVSENTQIQTLIKKAQKAGVHVSACRACAEQLEVIEPLESLDIEIIHWGVPLTKILKDGETLLTI